MAKSIESIIKKLPKPQRDKVNARAKELIQEELDRRELQGQKDRLEDEMRAHGGAPVVEIGDVQKPRYVNIKKVIEIEESFTVSQSDLTCEQLQERLENGDVNLVQVATIESYIWVVDKTGARVALLEKDGGCGPDERLIIQVN